VYERIDGHVGEYEASDREGVRLVTRSAVNTAESELIGTTDCGNHVCLDGAIGTARDRSASDDELNPTKHKLIAKHHRATEKCVAAERRVHLRASDAMGVGCSLSRGARQGVNAMASLNIALGRCNS
jgi:hypothetical protein